MGPQELFVGFFNTQNGSYSNGLEFVFAKVEFVPCETAKNGENMLNRCETIGYIKKDNVRIQRNFVFLV